MCLYLACGARPEPITFRVRERRRSELNMNSVALRKRRESFVTEERRSGVRFQSVPRDRARERGIDVDRTARFRLADEFETWTPYTSQFL